MRQGDGGPVRLRINPTTGMWTLRCAFCAVDEVEAGDDAVFVQGPFVAICGECVATCAQVIAEQAGALRRGGGEGCDTGDGGERE